MRHIYEDLMWQLLPIARAAVDAIMAVYSRGALEVQIKGDDSLVTEADLAAHCLLASRLKPLLSECPVVSEEDVESLVYRHSHGRFWLVDRLNGTKEFIARNG